MRNFSYIMVPSLLLLTLVISLLYRNEVKAIKNIVQHEEQFNIELAQQTIDLELKTLRSDLRFLAAQSNLREFIQHPSAETRQKLQHDWQIFSRHRAHYHQIRFIDNRGMEIIRINWNNGEPVIVSAAQLQDKSKRNYVQQTLTMQENDIYVSDFTLNIENYKVEQPIVPIIRIASPIMDQAGKKAGMLILNYLGQELLDKLRRITGSHNSALWLLNNEGFWILGPSIEQEWGFILADRKEHNLAKQQSALWQTMLNGKIADQLEHQSSTYTYTRIDGSNSPLGTNAQTWFVVSTLPDHTIHALLEDKIKANIIIFILFTVLLSLVGIIWANRNLTRQRANLALRRSESKFRSLLDSAPDAIIIVNSHGDIVLTNNHTFACLGYSKQELLGQSIDNLLPQRFRQHHSQHRNQYLSKPVVRQMGSGLELFALHKNGQEIPVEISLSPIESEDETLVISIVRDVSKRKQIEIARLSAEKRYHDLVDNLPIGVFRCHADATGRFTEANPSLANILKVDNSAALLQHCLSSFFAQPLAWQNLQQSMRQNRYINTTEYPMLTMEGKPFTANINAVVKQDEDGHLYYEGILEDISIRSEKDKRIKELNRHLKQHALQLEAANKELEAFSYSVSHDLRAPLRAMDGFSQTLLNQYQHKLDDKGIDRLKRIRSAAQRMGELIDALLELAKVARTQLNKQQVDLSRIATEVCNELQNQMRNIPELVIEADIKALTDPHLIRIVLNNLLGNAWKFSAKKSHARIEFGQLKDDEDNSVYFVKDNGAGFDMDYIDKLFTAFQRLHTTEEFSGTGIGLATVQRIVHKHGGKIWAQSEVGHGSVFYFTLEQAI
ncbi:PAS domain S-box protein [Neptunicella sp. SCSIO 80796]|uniref:sensor histidine kinase n=1 Tax=Neptunicella plasticusilytica TaxID=3117012 RepID=UPI003A4D3E87